MRRLFLLPAVMAGFIAAASVTPAHADTATAVVGSLGPLTTGQQVYQHVCQGCHMPDGKGAMGASAGFPAFAGDQKLLNTGYPIYIVLNGHGDMPWFSGMLSDKQIADVINYIRSSFGNHFPGKVTPEEVAAMKPTITMEDN
ncbi:MAG: cytochrome c [Acetobacter sp.]|jgi:mono/diheme cytochrome c family protein